jgi:phosphoribosylformimino-5-aminoimidazole carboxamide ribotide isomerase
MANTFQILPAIDMKDGRCVRLRQGRAEDETVYADDPLEMARRWVSEGAEYLHLVDLTGAFNGAPYHDEQVLRIASELGVPVEIGGGIRTDDQITRYLDGGVDRVIIGTRACDNPEELQRLVEQFGAGLAVGIDARDGFVQTRGWTETTAVKAVDLAQRMCALGVQTLIYTDTARDGMMKGVNTEAMAALCDAVSCRVIASGGVTVAGDVSALRGLRRENLAGVIVGKALYEGTVNMKELLCI